MQTTFHILFGRAPMFFKLIHTEGNYRAMAFMSWNHDLVKSLYPETINKRNFGIINLKFLAFFSLILGFGVQGWIKNPVRID